MEYLILIWKISPYNTFTLHLYILNNINIPLHILCTIIKLFITIKKRGMNLKLRVFRSLFVLLFLVVLAGIYFINPDTMTWTLFITAIIVYTILDLVTSFIIARKRSEDDGHERLGD